MKLEERSQLILKGRSEEKCASRFRICVLGARAVGKTALVVRFLTKRYIGEYRSGADFLYKKIITIDDNPTRLEILDTSNASDTEGVFPYSHVRWAEGFLVVYSIHRHKSFEEAAVTLETIQKIKSPLYVPLILLANHCDLPHLRQVRQEEGQSLALQYGCHYAEVSAADDPGGVSVTIEGLLREVRTLQNQRNAVRQRKTSLMNVSRLLGSLIGRNSGESSPQSTSNEHSPKLRESLRHFFAGGEGNSLGPERKLKTTSTMPNMEIYNEPQNNQAETIKENKFKSLRALRKRPSFSL